MTKTISDANGCDVGDTPAQWWTIPNLLSIVRLMGAPILAMLAIWQRPDLFVAWYLFLAITDWLDGKLAILLDQRSKIGPRIDTASDLAMYGFLMFGCFWLKSGVLWSEIGWIAAAAVSYALSGTISLIKFRTWPSYHTRAAKTSWLLVSVAVVAMLLDWSMWPFRVAMGIVTLANVEAIAISLLTRHRLTDVPTVYHALKRTG